MAKTKREYILATCFLSGAAAIISLVALGTQEWVTSPAKSDNITNSNDEDSVKFGLFGGVFKQVTAISAVFELTTVCAFDLNICALLCGNNAEDNLRKLYNHEDAAINVTDLDACPQTTVETYDRFFHKNLRASDTNDRIFINSGIWISTIIFLIISAIFGVISSGLAIWNTVTNPYQFYFSIFGLYIYNAVAFFSILLSIILWGAMFSQDLLKNIPTYKTFLEGFTTDGYASLGYSYWINLVSLIFYLISICLLYARDYLISKEPQLNNVPIEDTADPVLYLY